MNPIGMPQNPRLWKRPSSEVPSGFRLLAPRINALRLAPFDSCKAIYLSRFITRFIPQSRAEEITDVHDHTPRTLLVAHQYHPIPGAATLRLGQMVKAISPWTKVQVLTTLGSAGTPTVTTGPNNESIRALRARDASGQSLLRFLRLTHFMLLVSLSRESADLVISDPPPTAGAAAIWIARRHNALSVYYFCDSWAKVADRGGAAKRLLPIIRWLEDHCLRSADLVIAAETSLHEEAVSRGASEVALVLNGADIESIEAFASQPGENPFGAMPYFIYAGTHSDVHGARIFVEAAEVLWSLDEEFGVLFVGEGSDSTWIDERSLTEPRLQRWAPIELAALAPLLAGAVASLVSLGDLPEDYYATPSKIYTALATGCPIIYAGPPGPVSFLTQHDIGDVVPRTTHEIAGAMRRRLLADPGSGDELALASRAREYARQERDFASNLSHVSIRLRKLVFEHRHAAGRVDQDYVDRVTGEDE